MVDCRYGNENVNDILESHDEITDVLVLYNIRKFMQDKNLHKLDKKAGGMEKFDAESFFDEWLAGADAGACLKNHSRDLYSPIQASWTADIQDDAVYLPLMWDGHMLPVMQIE